jgi:hypothetical protein
VRSYRKYTKLNKTPRRPYQKERLEKELKLSGETRLRCNREVWTVATPAFSSVFAAAPLVSRLTCTE